MQENEWIKPIAGQAVCFIGKIGKMSFPEVGYSQYNKHLYDIPGSMKRFIVLFLLVAGLNGFAQSTDELQHIHIGKNCTKGNFAHSGSTFTLTGAGFDIWSSTDEFDFAWVKLWGDIEISVRINSLENIHEWTKAGIMIRENLTGPSKNAMMLLTPKNVASFQYRAFDNSGCSSISAQNFQFPCWLKLVRKGNLFYGMISSDAADWNLFEPVEIPMDGSVYYGLAVTSHKECVAAKATFEQLSITKTISEIPTAVSYHLIQHKKIVSSYLNEEVKITIGLPMKYDKFRQERYPVLYFLDHNTPTYHTLARELSAQGEIPDVITVGAAFPSETRRDSNYTVNFGRMHSFLTLELIKETDQNWHTDPLKRTLFGHSFGGLACLNTMFLYTDYTTIPFRNIIASSPATWWPDGKQIHLNEQNLFRQTSVLPVNLYMTIGTNEGFNSTSNFTKLARALDTRGYEYFNLITDANDGKTLATNSEISFTEGAEWVLNQPVVTPLSIASGIQATESDEIRIFPNPTSGILNIGPLTGYSGTIQLELIDLSGKVLAKTALKAETFISWNLKDARSGIFFIQIKTDRKVFRKKIGLY